MGRHSAPSRARQTPKTPAAALAVALVVAGGGVAAMALNRSGSSTVPAGAVSSDNGSAPGSGDLTPVGSTDGAAASGPGCPDGPVIAVSASPDLAPLVMKMTDAIESKGGTDCYRYRITAIPSGLQATRLADGSQTPPQIWIPDSPIWVQQANARAKTELAFGDPFASSPVGLAVPATITKARTGPLTWAMMMSDISVPIAMSDPNLSTASLMALASARKAANDPAKAAIVKQSIVALARNPRGERELMQLAGGASPQAAVFPASEQQMLAEHATFPDHPVKAITLADGAPWFQYGLVSLPGKDADGTRTAQRAAERLKAALTSDEGKAALTGQGFRVDGKTTGSVPGMVATQPTDPAATTPSTTDTEAALVAWTAVRRPMRMLVAIDVSGSMKEATAPKLSRIQLAAGASGQALVALPDETQMGVWVFSTNRGPNGEPWHEEAPIRPLGSQEGNATFRQRLQALAASFPSMPGGGTGLYDTIKAAVETVQKGYDPERVNSVVVMTDGKDEGKGKVSEQAMIDFLKAEALSDKPVRVVLIGMGGTSDMEALNKVAAASGGSAYTATTPEAMMKVISGAIGARIGEQPKKP